MQISQIPNIDLSLSSSKYHFKPNIAEIYIHLEP